MSIVLRSGKRSRSFGCSELRPHQYLNFTVGILTPRWPVSSLGGSGHNPGTGPCPRPLRDTDATPTHKSSNGLPFLYPPFWQQI